MSKKSSTTQIFIALAITSGVLGTLIFLGLLFSLSGQFTIGTSGKIDMGITSQVGDFIGGVVGSIWSMTAIFLFYLALELNRKEFNLQREQLELQRIELKNQNIESQLNRITSIVYKQIDICNLKIDNFQIISPRNKNQIKGRIAIKYINTIFNKYPNIHFDSESIVFIDGKEYDLDDIYIRMIELNKEELILLTDAIYNSCLLIQFLIATELQVDNLMKDELKLLFLGNLGKDIDVFFLNLFKIMKTLGANNSDIFKQIKEINSYQTFSYKNSINKREPK